MGRNLSRFLFYFLERCDINLSLSGYFVRQSVRQWCMKRKEKKRWKRGKGCVSGGLKIALYRINQSISQSNLVGL